MRLPAERGSALIRMAMKRQTEDRQFLQWVVQLPYMSSDSFMSFESYKRRLSGEDIDRRPTAEILSELDGIERYFASREAENGT